MKMAGHWQDSTRKYTRVKNKKSWMWKVTANKGEFKSDPSMETTVGAVGDY